MSINVSMSGENSLLYQFADCVIDKQQQRLYRGGKPLDMEPKPFQVLLFLLEHRGELVTHQQLFEHCWPGVFVTDGALLRCVSRIRRAIGQGGSYQPIETVYRKGYRFVGEVMQRDADDTFLRAAEEADLTATSVAPVSLASQSIEHVPVVAPDLPRMAASDQATLTDNPTATTLPTTVTAEWRQISIVSCRWLLAEADTETVLDIELLYQRGQQLRERVEALTSPLGGQLMYATQEELVLYFGYPHAFEDSAQRAVLAGLRLVDQALHAPPDTTDLQNLSLQVGVHTGPIVVELTASENAPAPLSVGPTHAIASQLSKHAPAQQVVASEATVRLVSGHFHCHPLKTANQPSALALYQVSDPPSFSSDVVIETSQPLMPFVGREWELALLKERWTQARDGHGQVVWLSGDPGIGKSRLVQQLTDHLGDQACRYWECQSSAFHQHRALFPLVELLRRILHQSQPGSSGGLIDDEQQLEVLSGRYQLGETAVPLLADLLSLSLPAERYPPLTLDAREQRQLSFQLLLGLLLSEAQSQPLLLVIEDLHWADPSTLEFVQLLIHQVPTTALLLILTARPAFSPPWNHEMAVTPLRLDRLNHQQSEQLLWRLTEGRTLPASLVANLVAKTDGVPLFIEELTRTLLESPQFRAAGAGLELVSEPHQISIPVTLQESLMARLDCLGASKAIAQRGSVLGREFSYTLLAAVSPWDESVLQQSLQELLAAGLIHQRGVGLHTEYVFKHALIRDCAYQSLLHHDRQQIHADVVRTLETRFPELVAEHPALVAQHYTHADQLQAAIPYWNQAGRDAAARWANEEAIEYLQIGLKCLAELPDTPERARQELDLQILLGPCLRSVLGMTDSAVEQCYERTRDLCDQLNETEPLFPALVNLWRFNHDCTRYERARHMAEELVRQARRNPHDPRQLPVAYQALGISMMRQGELHDAADFLQKSVSLFERSEPVAVVDSRYSMDARVQSLGYHAIVLILQGYPQQALQNAQQIAALAPQLQRVNYRAMALYLVSIIHLLRGEREQTLHYIEAVIALATEIRLQTFLAMGKIVKGWLIAMDGDAETGVAMLRRGMHDFDAANHPAAPLWQLLLAEACAEAGQAEQALIALEEGLSFSQRTGEQLFDPALYQFRGVLMQQPCGTDLEQVEAQLQLALECARHQQAKWWELRAAVSLAEIWKQQGKSEPARQLLSPVVEWFTEGFDTNCLRQVMQLLKTL